MRQQSEDAMEIIFQNVAKTSMNYPKFSQVLLLNQASLIPVTMHVYCILQCQKYFKSSKQLQNFTEKSRNKCCSNHFQGCPLSN